MKNIAVLGSGSWGTALALHLSNAGHNVWLWGRNPDLISEIVLTRVGEPPLTLRFLVGTAASEIGTAAPVAGGVANGT